MINVSVDYMDAPLAKELEPLIKAHTRETCGEDLFEKMNWPMYFLLQEMGAFLIVVAREGIDAIGYNSYTISESMHDITKIQARQDGIFIIPEHRNKSIVAKLIKKAESAMKSAGVNQIFYSKPSGKFGVELTKVKEI